MKVDFSILVAAIGSIVVGCAGTCAAEEPAEDARLDVTGFVDVVFAYNFNEPADHANFFPGVGTSAKRDNEFDINLAQVDFVLAPEPIGFHVALGYGTATEVVHAAEVSGVATDPDVWQNVIQASMQYQTKIGRGLVLEAGVYPSHIGLEAFATKDNWNYTRSWLGELSPYYQTGVKAAYPFGERWSGQLHLLNGWQMIADNNRGKSVGWQIARSSDKLSLSFNGIFGPELPDNNHDIRVLFDTVAVYKVTPSLSLGLSIDAARQERPGSNAEWNGIGLYGRIAPPEARTAFALRAECYDDDDGAISGTPQTLEELTLTLEHRPVERLIVKLEGRYDRSTAPVFDAERDQFLALVGAVAKF